MYPARQETKYLRVKSSAGLEGPQDYMHAYMWVNLAAEHMKGEEQKHAVGNRDDGSQRMTSAQITEAKRLSQESQAKTFTGCCGGCEDLSPRRTSVLTVSCVRRAPIFLRLLSLALV
jgi:hypothetical protein